MRSYLLKIIGAVILYSLGEALLPEGNIKKYSCVILALMVTLAILSPLSISEDLIPDIFDQETYAVSDTFSDDVRQEYKNRIENMIFEATGEEAEVIIDDEFLIKEVYTTEKGQDYVINNLGVDHSAVKTR